MPFQWNIQINLNPQSPPRVTFSPNPLPAAVRDQIFWTNNDANPHWPGLVNADGSINKTFFMPNQIAGGGDTSAVFAPSLAGTLNYADSLNPSLKGSITVTG